LVIFSVIDIQMESRLVSEFTLEKRTPATLSPQERPLPPCPNCAIHLASVTELRKRDILLELHNEQLKAEKDRLERERDELIAARVLTYE
jgi:hypothetical protein